MELFPEFIGRLKRTSEPSGYTEKEFVAQYYTNCLGTGSTDISYKIENQSQPYVHQPDDNAFPQTENVVIYYVPENRMSVEGFSVTVFAGKKVASIADIGCVEDLNELVSNFPYAQFGITPPALPVKISLPPPDFVKERGNRDKKVDDSARKIVLQLVKSYFTVKSVKSDAKIGELDSSTLLTGVKDSNFDGEKEFVEKMGKSLRGLGFRQAVINGSVYPLR